jgi:hypothetical protein
MLVAEIAYQHLDPEIKRRADALIATYDDGYDFVSAGTWADDIKDHDDTEFNAWHSITLTFEQIDDPLPTRADFPTEQQIVWAIHHEKRILKDRKATDVEKGLALRRLIHWVGDIHQPLHTATHVASEYPEGDRGGSAFLITLDPVLFNLHRLWDSGLGQWIENKPRPLSEHDKRQIKIEAKLLQQYAPSDLGSMNPGRWALDHHALARDYAYSGMTYLGTPTDDYLEKGAILSRYQVTLAGLRLAAILNEVLAQP